MEPIVIGTPGWVVEETGLLTYSLTWSDYRCLQMESIVTLSDAKARLSEIVKKAVDGEEFVITRMGEPAVRISRYEPRNSVPALGDLKDQISIAEDFDSWPPDLEAILGIAEPK